MERERCRKQISKSSVFLCLGLAVGCLFSNVRNDAGIILKGGNPSNAAVATGGDGGNNGGNGAGDVGKLKRYRKYSQTYRYITPASRYDYVPVPAKECGSGPTFDPWWKLSQSDRSRLGEDRFIYETFFANRTTATTSASDDGDGFTGTYVELGAFDGRTESNTRFFDVCLGWKGLLIEGNPGNYEKTISNRPYAHKMSFAPSCSAEYEAANGTVQFYRYPMTNVGLVGHAKTYEKKPTVDVPCGPLSPVLEDVFGDDAVFGGGGSARLPTLDFFSLDVEGAEMLVLSTIDFGAVRINVLMIEIKNNHCRTEECKVRTDVRAKMAAEGYKRYEKLVPASDIYVHPESPFQVPESVAVPKLS